MLRIDVNAFVGHYPFRKVDGGSPALLIAALERVGVDEAWVGNLPAIFWRDPTEGNETLYQIAARHGILRPVPAVHPGLDHWEEVVAEAVDRGAPAVRADPTFFGLAPNGREMAALAARLGEARLPLVVAVRLEDGRQRHPNDVAPELAPWAVRGLIRSHPGLELVVTHADREFIEQVHFGATPAEAARIHWDISMIWGPPSDDLAHLVTTIGADRLCFGTGLPLRIPEVAIAKLDLLRCTPTERTAIESGNARRLGGRPGTGNGER